MKKWLSEPSRLTRNSARAFPNPAAGYHISTNYPEGSEKARVERLDFFVSFFYQEKNENPSDNV